MSHLSTIISRIETEIERHDDPMATGMMKQHLDNLREYPTVWDDATEEELERRQEILEKKEWVAESYWKVECMAEDCDSFEDQRFDTEEEAQKEANKHSLPPNHVCVWENVVETPARNYNVKEVKAE